MAIQKRNIRSVQDIRTLSGRVDQISEPYRAYMRITCLEMEKARRGKESESAMQRVRNIGVRLKEIEAEKAELLRSLGERNSVNSAYDPSASSSPSPRPGHGGFKIRY